ncbi:UDP-N-acetylglucosamine--N-acetylmuramyl-(pentapeptide) pyrophosphoryl-undecaprenol N-acetylglucosamine transferase [Streptomyces fumanus]
MPGMPPYIPVSYLDRINLLRRGRHDALPRGRDDRRRTLPPAVGLPAAYVPLPIGNGEQRLNAQPVVKAGGGLLVDDAELTPEWVQQNVLPVLADPHRLYACPAPPPSSAAGTPTTSSSAWCTRRSPPVRTASQG